MQLNTTGGCSAEIGKARASEIDAVMDAFSATESLLARVCAVVSRIAGPVPTNSTETGCPPRPMGVLPELRSRAEDLMGLGGYVTAELDRLERML